MISITDGADNGFYSCLICGKKEDKSVKKIKIDTHYGVNIICFGICEICMKELIDEIAESMEL